MATAWKAKGKCSFAATLLHWVLKLNRRFWNNRQEISVPESRTRLETLARRIPKRCVNLICYTQAFEEVTLTWFEPPKSDQTRVVVYLPGGAFIAGSATTTHRDLISRLASQTGVPFVGVNYRKAPEYPFPAAVTDIFNVYKHLLQQYPADKISVVGDSAGGCLALVLGLKLRDEALPLPAKIVALCPVTDLSGSGNSWYQNRDSDAMIPTELIHQLAVLYVGKHDLTEPYISPLYGVFDGFPETLIQVSDAEVLLDDALRIADKMRAANTPVQLDIWHRLPHVWHAFAAILPEGRAAIKDIAAFLNR